MLYLVYCWLIPGIVVFGGFVFLGPMGGMLVAAGAFLLPRRAIRSCGGLARDLQAASKLAFFCAHHIFIDNILH